MPTTQQFRYPNAASVSISAEATNGTPIPSQSLLIGAEDPSGNINPLKIDASSFLEVNVQTSSLPSGAATSANQTTEISKLTTISGQLPSSLGAQLTTASLSVNIASDQVVPVSATSLPLPTGAATSVNQTTEIASLNTISGQLPSSLGAQLIAASLSVNIASNQTVPISAVSLPLPTGAATEATLSTLATETTLSAVDNKLPATLGQTTMSASLAVAIASDQSALNINNISGTVSLPTGAATSANQTTGNTSLASIATNTSRIPSLGQTTMSGSTPVAIASDQTTLTIAIKGKSSANAPVYTDYSSTNVNSASYVQIVASTTSAANMIEIFDSSGQSVYLAVGGSGSEVNQLIIIPGGNGQVPLSIPAGSRISLKAVNTTASVGINIINLYS